MEKTLEKYRQAIQDNQVNPLAHWDGQESRTIFDPADPAIPLEMLAFGAYQLQQGPFTVDTDQREYILCPIDCEFQVTLADQVFHGARRGGPFATQPSTSNACAIYVGRDQQFKLSGTGELVWFSAPADQARPALFVKPGQEKQVTRGQGLWHREVITLINPDTISSNMTFGETYSPPGLWSGTPLHTHDKEMPEQGESDLEEVYYHVSRLHSGQWPAYGVQLMFDHQGMDKAFMIHHRDAIAIPGGAHPVVAGPASDMLYVWALAGRPGSELMMRDVPEFAYLKIVERIVKQLEDQRGPLNISAQQLAKLIASDALQDQQLLVLKQHLAERGINIT